MDHRDDWPDMMLEGDPDSGGGKDPAARKSAERIARDARNMNAVLSAMANRLSDRLPAIADRQTGPLPRRRAWSWRTVGPLVAAAAIAVLILARNEHIEKGRESVAFPTPPTAPSMVSEMNVEADGPFVVFPTSDPDIAVVWLLNPKESD